MCSTSINRRNILRQVRSGEITGVSLFHCAICLVARLGLHPCCSRKVYEKLVELERDYCVELHDAVLVIISSQRRGELLKAREEEAKRKWRARVRAEARRTHGIRGLQALPAEVSEDPDWDPDEPTTEETETEAWALRTHTPTPPAGEWDARDAELSTLIANQKLDNDICNGHEAVLCGSLSDLAEIERATTDCDLVPDPAEDARITFKQRRHLAAAAR